MTLTAAVHLVLDDYRRHDLQCIGSDAAILEALPELVDLEEIREDHAAGRITPATAEAYAVVLDAHPHDLAAALAAAA